MEALEAITKRVSVREYSEKEVKREELEEIVNAGRYAATANNVQPWEFIIVQDKSTRIKLKNIAPKNGPYMEFSPAVIIVTCKSDAKHYLEDGCAATQNMLVAARALGLGSVWIAGDKKEYAGNILKALNIPEEFRLISMICIGYPENGFNKTPKRPLKELLHWEKF